MTNSVKKEGRTLTIDPHIIFDVIKSQAGTLDKAIAELVMNSIDAGATRIDITLDNTSFRIKDDGKGFQSKEAILNWFEKFGTKHTEGDAKYGRFRMGRGQALSFASTVWHSGKFRMDVDILKRGLDYDLHEVETPVTGCLIEGIFYTPINKMQTYGITEERNLPTGPNVRASAINSSLTRLKTAIAKMIQYVEVPVYVNDVQLNRSVAAQSWTIETNDGYMKLSMTNTESSDLEIYNMGVYVCSIPSWRSGCSGLILSKKALKVNFARNSILQEECRVYQRIMAKVEQFINDSMPKKLIKNEQQRSFIARRIIDNKIPLEEAMSLRVFTDIQNRHVSFKDMIAGYNIFTMPDEDTHVSAAEHVHKNCEVFVFSRKNLERFQANGPDEFINLIGSLVPFIGLNFLEFFHFEDEYQGYSKLLKDDDLTFKEMLVLRSLRKYQKLINSIVIKVSDIDEYSRRLVIGESDKSMGWTDGATYIALDRKLLKLADHGIGGFSQICGIIAHEYCHYDEDSDSHYHDEDFYEHFHDALFPGDNGAISKFGVCALKMCHEYINLLALNNHKLPSNILKEVESSKVVFGQYVLSENSQLIAEALKRAKVISSEKFLTICDWILSLEVNSYAKEWMISLARTAGDKKGLKTTVDEILSNNKKNSWVYGFYSQQIIASGAFHELMSRLEVELPKNLFTVDDKRDLPGDDTEIDFISIDKFTQNFIKEHPDNVMSLEDLDVQINPYKFLSIARYLTSVMRGEQFFGYKYAIECLAQFKVKEISVALHRLKLLRNFVKKKNKYSRKEPEYVYNDGIGFVLTTTNERFSVDNYLLMAAAHSKIENHTQYNKEDLLSKTKLNIEEVRKLFKPIKQKIRSSIY